MVCKQLKHTQSHTNQTQLIHFKIVVTQIKQKQFTWKYVHILDLVAVNRTCIQRSGGCF